MRIHARNVTRADIIAAARIASQGGHGTIHVEATEHRSMTQDTAWEVHLAGDGSVSRRRPGFAGADSGDYAATWQAWGWFLAALYRVQPAMTCGTPGRPTYADVSDFHVKTGGRFRILPGDAEYTGVDYGEPGDVSRVPLPGACALVLSSTNTGARAEFCAARSHRGTGGGRCADHRGY